VIRLEVEVDEESFEITLRQAGRDNALHVKCLGFFWNFLEGWMIYPKFC
jgi:hypothetical protein